MSLAATIKTLRMENDLTQEQLAVAAGISTRTIWSLEKGKKIPGRKSLLKICFALGLTMSEEIYPIFKLAGNLQKFSPKEIGYYYSALGFELSNSVPMPENVPVSPVHLKVLLETPDPKTGMWKFLQQMEKYAGFSFSEETCRNLLKDRLAHQTEKLPEQTE